MIELYVVEIYLNLQLVKYIFYQNESPPVLNDTAFISVFTSSLVVVLILYFARNKGGVNFCIAPSTAMQLDFDLNKNTPGDFVLETAGYLIHRIGLNNDAFSEIMTYTVNIPEKRETEIKYPFN